MTAGARTSQTCAGEGQSHCGVSGRRAGGGDRADPVFHPSNGKVMPLNQCLKTPVRFRVDGSMGTVVEDVTSETIDAQHIRRRVNDWEKRLNGLFAAIGRWLPDGWEPAPKVPRSSCTRS